MAGDSEKDRKRIILEISELAAQIICNSEEFSKKLVEVADMGISGFDITFAVKGLRPGVKKIKKPKSPVKFSEIALTGKDRELAKKAKIKIDENEVKDLKKAFSEILRENKSDAAEEETEIISNDDNDDPETEETDYRADASEEEEFQEEDEYEDEDERERWNDHRPIKNILGSIGRNLHEFSAVHRLLFIFGISKLNLFKHLNLSRYLSGDATILLFNEKDWLEILERIFRTILKTEDPEAKRMLLLSLEDYILCVMKTIGYFEDLGE